MAYYIRYTELVHCMVLSSPFGSYPSLPNTTVPMLKGIFPFYMGIARHTTNSGLLPLCTTFVLLDFTVSQLKH